MGEPIYPYKRVMEIYTKDYEKEIYKLGTHVTEAYSYQFTNNGFKDEDDPYQTELDAEGIAFVILVEEMYRKLEELSDKVTVLEKQKNTLATLATELYKKVQNLEAKEN